MTLTALGVLAREAAFTLAITLTCGLAIWGYFGLRYRWLRHRCGLDRSASRAGKDMTMVACFVAGVLLPAGLAWYAVGAEGFELIEPPLRGGEAVFVTLSGLLIPYSILVSSSVDWYLIRAFREGLYDDPPCQEKIQRSGQGMHYSRYWIMHRMVAEFLVYASIVVIIALSATIAGEATHSDTGENVFNLIGLIGILSWSLAELGKLKAALDFVRFPTCSLGSWASGRNEDGEEISGFVLDVSIDPGVQLIEEPRGHPAMDIADEARSVPLSQRRSIHSMDPPRPICPGGKCEFWIPDCEVGLRALERLPDSETQLGAEAGAT